MRAPIEACDGRDEAVHLAVQAKLFGDVARHRLQRAAVVVEPDLGRRRDDAVGDHRRELSIQKGVFAALPPARHEIVTFVELCEHHRDVRRIVLKIGVDGHDGAPARRIEACLHRGRLPEIAAESHANAGPRPFSASFSASAQLPSVEPSSMSTIS